MVRFFMILIPMAAAASAVGAETIILKDGTFVEGRVTLETSVTLHVETRFGLRAYDQGEIERVIKGAEPIDPDAINRFDELSAPVQALLNARADYALGRYKEALARLQRFRDDGRDQAPRVQMDRLVIDIHERLGHWSEAERMLQAQTRSGLPQERLRAKAHLAVFEANPDYDLRYIGRKHARNFIRDESLRLLAREPDALRDHRVMRAALEEYCEQLLVEDNLSVKAFADKLDADSTHQAIANAHGTGDLGRRLPYIKDLKRAEATLVKAQAILGDYGIAFELDLARTELNHLLPVLERLLTEAITVAPQLLRPSVDRKTGTWSPEARAEWQERSDEFIEASRPVSRLLSYMVDKAEHYPEGLRDLLRTLIDRRDRFENMVKTVKRGRRRTRG